MAIAPVNKFVSISVPVAPGLQKLYEVPTGTSALLLYTQVANVGIGVTYPNVTFNIRRQSRSTGNTRDIRVIKEVEIPPNDAVILVDGRLVLEKTPLVLDQIYVKGAQEGVGIITGVSYDEPSGIATVFTKTNHNFNVTDPITLSGIAFTCSGSTGITTTVFPDPQQSYVVDTVANVKEFSTVVGGSKGYPHFYNSAIHYFERSRDNAIEVSTGTGGYTTYTAATGTTYNPATGDLVVTTTSAHNFSVGDLCRIDDNGITFTCTLDPTAPKSYPRSTDPASAKLLTVTAVSGTSTFTVNVGPSSASDQYAHTFSSAVTNAIKKINKRIDVKDAIYNGGPNAIGVGTTFQSFDGNPFTQGLGVGEIVIQTDVAHGLVQNQKVRIAVDSIIFSCTMDNRATEHAYPRKTDPAAPRVDLTVSIVSTDKFRVNVGQSLSGGFFAPLQMELIASILENSTA